MSVIKLNDISKSYGITNVLTEIQLDINDGEKIGVVGGNESGKSTLIKILMNSEEYQSGEIWKTPSLNVAYMSQEVFDLNEEKTIFL